MRLPPKKFSETGRRLEDVIGAEPICEVSPAVAKAIGRFNKKAKEIGLDHEIPIPPIKQRAKAALEHLRHPEAEVRTVTSPVQAQAAAEIAVDVNAGMDVHAAVAKHMGGSKKAAGRALFGVAFGIPKEKLDQKMLELAEPAIKLPPISVNCMPCEYCGKAVKPGDVPYVLEYGPRPHGQPEFLGKPWKRVAHSHCFEAANKTGKKK